MQGDSPMHEESSISSNNNSARRPSMTPNISSYNKKPTNVITAEKRQLEIQYSSKKLRYANLKKTFADKQVKQIFVYWDLFITLLCYCRFVDYYEFLDNFFLIY